MPLSMVTQRRLRAHEYRRMVEAGVFDEDERLELLGGLLVSMSPHGIEHARVIQRLTRLLVRALGDEHVVRLQLPLSLADDAEPEPDVAIVAAAEAEAGDTHPRSASLVVEVAADSLEKDRGLKAALYAQAGIPDYWIVNLSERVVEVYRDPSPGTARYRTAFTRAPGETLAPLCAPDVILALSHILGVP